MTLSQEGINVNSSISGPEVEAHQMLVLSESLCMKRSEVCQLAKLGSHAYSVEPGSRVGSLGELPLGRSPFLEARGGLR